MCSQIQTLLTNDGEMITIDRAETNEVLIALGKLFSKLGQTPA